MVSGMGSSGRSADDWPLMPAESSASALVGRTFLSTAVTERGVPRQLPAGTSVMLWFTGDERLVAHGGCNTISGHVELSDGRIAVPDAAMTQMGCEHNRMAQDNWLSALLDARPSWRLSGPHLRVSAGGTIIELTDRRVLDPDRPLEGTRWVGSALVSGRVMGSLAALDDVFLVFADGQVSGSDSRQPLSGPAVVSGDTIDFGPGVAVADGDWTRRGSGELARHVHDTLRGRVRYEIEADQLKLQGAVGLWLTADPDPPDR
jgi:heat shock protein HslJ